MTSWLLLLFILTPSGSFQTESWMPSYAICQATANFEMTHADPAVKVTAYCTEIAG